MNTKLFDAVVKQLGYSPTNRNNEELIDTLRDVSNHGASNGFSGFIYYSETVKFFKKNRQEIIGLCKEMASDFGQDLISFVASFNCLTDNEETRDEIGRAIYGRMRSADTLVANALAWFALEEVARYRVNELENA